MFGFLKHSKPSLILIAIAFFLPACFRSTTHTMTVFGEEVRFRQDPLDADAMIYRNESIGVTAYTSFLIDPVFIASEATADNRGINPTVKNQLSEAFRNELIQVLGEKYKIADKPGPSVLRIRAAIIEFHPTTIELDEDRFIAMRFDTALQSAEIQLDCLDSLTGERVVSLVRTLQGPPYNQSDSTARIQNIREAFHDWALALRKRFDAAKVKTDLMFQQRNDETSPNYDPTKEHQNLNREQGQ